MVLMPCPVGRTQQGWHRMCPFMGQLRTWGSWHESERPENVRSYQFLREKYPYTFGEYKTVRGGQVEGCTECVPVYFSSPEEARDLPLKAQAESVLYNNAECSPAHCPAFADEDRCHLFLRDCTYPDPAARAAKEDFQIHCGSDLSAVEVLPLDLELVPLTPDTTKHTTPHHTTPHHTTPHHTTLHHTTTRQDTTRHDTT